MDQRIIDLYYEYTHAPLDRRTFLERLATLTGGRAAATALLPLLQASKAAAFHNDTSAARYDAAAAKLAWDRTIAFFDSELKR